MNAEGFEEWDADFLDQLIQVEELALSSSNPTHHPPHFPQPRPCDQISYSPPRELSQRFKDGSNNRVFDQGVCRSSVVVVAPPCVPWSRNPKEDEIERLKRELARVSKQLTHLEQDCLQLQKEKDEKEEQLKSVFSQIEAKNVEVQCRKSKNLEHGVRTHDHPGSFLEFKNGNSSSDRVDSPVNVVTSTCKAIGVQTDKSEENTHASTKNDVSTLQHRQNKLLAVWNSSSSQGSQRNMVSNLLVACESDFRVLFGCLGLFSKTVMNSLAAERSSDLGLQERNQPALSAEAAKVSDLYSMLTMIGTGLVKLEDLFEPLVDLCSLENDVIIYRSLRVLRKVLNHTLSLETKSHINVMYSGIML